jgi:CO dehydrogenase/acetyl-CoA synthase beta subunit
MEFHVDIGPQYEGETVRKDEMYVEFGGPNVKAKFELVT